MSFWYYVSYCSGRASFTAITATYGTYIQAPYLGIISHNSLKHFWSDLSDPLFIFTCVHCSAFLLKTHFKLVSNFWFPKYSFVFSKGCILLWIHSISLLNRQTLIWLYWLQLLLCVLSPKFKLLNSHIHNIYHRNGQPLLLQLLLNCISPRARSSFPIAVSTSYLHLLYRRL